MLYRVDIDSVSLLSHRVICSRFTGIFLKQISILARHPYLYQVSVGHSVMDLA